MSDYTYTIGKELDLVAEQEATLAAPKLKANLVLQGLFITFDVLYGKKRVLPKFRVLEILARYPYWAWENNSYFKITRHFSHSNEPSKTESDRLLGLIELGRESQDNEAYHLFLLDSIIHNKGIKLGWFKHNLMPRLMSFGYYFFTKALYRVSPKASFAMNAAFESHAEHEYMLMAQENPEWDEEAVESKYFEYYPQQKSLRDLVRRIGLDERDHMHHSLEEIEKLKK